jgi:DNA end-binding protein Ku
MARAIWSGAINFGLVSVPVKLYSATSPKTVRFHQLHAQDGGRIRQKRVCSLDGEEVAYEDVVKGYELSPDRYVVITQDELDAIDPGTTKAIDIEDFVDLVEIDPIYFDHAYYAVPGTGAAKPYKLLMEAMERSGKVAIGRFVMRTKQQLCALRPANGVLTLSTMLFGDEVNAPDALDELESLGEAKATDREVTMAEQLIGSLASDWEPEKYHDTYREQVLELIERKASGEEIVLQPETEEPAPTPDLMAALEQSLEAARKRAAGDGKAEKPKAKPKPKAKKSPSSNGGAKRTRSTSKSR